MSEEQQIALGKVHAELTKATLERIWKNRGWTRGFPKWECELMKSACEALGVPYVPPKII